MRNFLFVPGNNPKMLSSASFLGSDAIIIDLEDAVPVTEKDAARILVRNAIQVLQYTCKTGVRINSVETAEWKKDLAAVIPLNIPYIMLPKTESAEDIQKVVAEIEALEAANTCNGITKIIALIETAPGIENAFEIAKAHDRVEALFLGAEDLTANLCAVRTKGSEEILYSRGRIVCAARAAGKDVYDTPFTDVEDMDGLIADARFARKLGFTGKASISPRHIDGINQEFTPSEAEVADAVGILKVIEEGAQKGLGVVTYKGKMVDAPIAARARYVLALMEEIRKEAGV